MKSSYLWQYFQQLKLHQPIRDSIDLEYSRWVDSIGEGNPSQPVSTINMQHFLQFTTYDEAIVYLFPQDILSQPYEAIKRSYLSPYNNAVDEFNKQMVDKIPQNEC